MQDTSGREGRGFEARRLDQKSEKWSFHFRIFLFILHATGFEGGSRFASAKRFAKIQQLFRKVTRQRTTLRTSERGAPLKAKLPPSPPKKAWNFKGFRAFILQFPKTSPKNKAVFDRLRRRIFFYLPFFAPVSVT